MMLDQVLSTRFHVLYNSLIGWVANQLGYATDAATRAHQEAVDSAFGVAKFLWEGAGHTDFIDDFIADNPIALDAEARAILMSWKEALSSDFALVRKGDEVIALLGDHAFSVYGAGAEVDEGLAAFPTIAHTTLIPFAGKIICAPAFTSFPLPLEQPMVDQFMDAVEVAEAEGTLARTAEDFFRLAPVAREERLADDAEEFARQTELEMNADELGEGQHAGVLAGLSWNEREGAYQKHMDDIRQGLGLLFLIHELEYGCRDTKPVHTLWDLYRTYTKDQLLRLAAKRDVPGNLAQMTKRDLISGVIAAEPLDPFHIINAAIARGTSEVNHMRDVVRAGGTRYYPHETLGDFDDVPMTLSPYLFLTPLRDRFMATMPREIVEALSHVDWETAHERAAKTDSAVRFIDRLVDFCGVVPYESAMQELDDYCGEFIDPMLLVSALMERLRYGLCSFELVRTREGALFFVHPHIADECGVDEEGVLIDPEAIQDMIILQDGRRPRPVGDLDERERVATWVQDCQSYRDFVAYLDAHVPDSHDDYLFASHLVDECVSALRDMVDITYIFEMLEDEGFVATEAQTRKICLLVRDLIADVPHWYLNGWTTHEIAAGLDIDL